MVDTEISPDQWPLFCNQFSQQHHGWLVTLSVIETQRLEAGPEAADRHRQLLVADAAFQGITAEHRGEEGSGLSIFVGESPQRVSHWIRQPVCIRFEQTCQGAHQGLRIDAADGETTLVRFRTAALPETLDGIADF